MLNLEELKWYNIPSENLDTYGFDDGNKGIRARIPDSVTKDFSKALADSALFSAGGRIRFATNSKHIGLKVTYGFKVDSDVACTRHVCRGFVLYKNEGDIDIPVHIFCPPADNKDDEYCDTKEIIKNDETYNYTLIFPCLTQVLSCQIGIDKDADLKEGKKYINKKPIIFYGSSITHGLAASNSGNIYEQFISRKYNVDYVNLGFAGNAKGETSMAEYISKREMCAFVCDYDHNAPDAEHLKKTYPVLYETIRKNHPVIPYIVISKPDYLSLNKAEQASNEERRSFIEEFYKSHRLDGDENIYFIDGSTFFPKQYNLCCTADLCHPNDLGFSYMSEIIGKVLADALGLKN